MMKKALLFSVLLASLTLASCQKSGVNLFVGDYSYKTTGSVTVQRQLSLFDSEIPPAYEVELPSDLGQLQIATLDRKADSVVVIFNQLNGDVLVTHARCEDNEITLLKFQREILMLSIDANNDLKFPVTISGEGHIYDGKTILFNLSYKGKAKVGDLTYNLQGEDVNMVAYRN